MIKIKNLNFQYTHKVFENYSCELGECNYVNLAGVSGTGKTTLFKIIAGFLKADCLEMEVAGIKLNNDLQPHQRDVAMVFQHTALWPHLTVSKNIRLVGENSSLAPEQWRTWQAEVIKKSLFDKKCCELSAGEQQRVEIIRALASGKKILLLDEPFAFQDPLNIEKLVKVIREYIELTKGIVIFTTHNQDNIKYFPESSVIKISGEIS